MKYKEEIKNPWHINNKSDFKIKEHGLSHCSSFEIKYYVIGSSYSVTATYNGTDYINCELQDGGDVLVCFDKPEFSNGGMFAEYKIRKQDSTMEDGYFDFVSIESIPIVIYDGKTEIEVVDTTFDIPQAGTELLIEYLQTYISDTVSHERTEREEADDKLYKGLYELLKNKIDNTNIVDEYGNNKATILSQKFITEKIQYINESIIYIGIFNDNRDAYSRAAQSDIVCNSKIAFIIFRGEDKPQYNNSNVIHQSYYRDNSTGHYVTFQHLFADGHTGHSYTRKITRDAEDNILSISDWYYMELGMPLFTAVRSELSKLISFDKSNGNLIINSSDTMVNGIVANIAINSNAILEDVAPYTSQSQYGYRIPAIAEWQGNVYVGFDHRISSNAADVGQGSCEIQVRKKSINTWEAVDEVNGSFTDIKSSGKSGSVGDISMCADKETGKLVTLFAFGASEYGSKLGVARGTENGGYEDITNTIYSLLTTASGGVDVTWAFAASGRICQSSVVKKGQYYRIFSSFMCRYADGSSSCIVLYSDDLGSTWNSLGRGDTKYAVRTIVGDVAKSDEAKLVELSDGSLIISSRADKCRNINKAIYSATGDYYDWGNPALSGVQNKGLACATCNGEMILVNAKGILRGENVQLLLHTVPSDYNRKAISFYMKVVNSSMEPAAIASNWTKVLQVTPSDITGAYSSMTLQSNGKIGFVAEVDKNRLSSATLSIIYKEYSLEEITNNIYKLASTDYQKESINKPINTDIKDVITRLNNCGCVNLGEFSSGGNFETKCADYNIATDPNKSVLIGVIKENATKPMNVRLEQTIDPRSNTTTQFYYLRDQIFWRKVTWSETAVTATSSWSRIYPFNRLFLEKTSTEARIQAKDIFGTIINSIALPIVQTTGTSATDIISQKAVTDLIQALRDEIEELKSTLVNVQQ